jgi:L,D-peptidoglycan transpeptidase YkuD (ErfK/YbiS/YcfS/YnhG family)
MTKTLFLTVILLSFASASEQLIVVLSKDMNTTSASMQRYVKENRWHKVGAAVPVTLGRSGLGHSEGAEPLKVEGDGRSPAGLFEISRTFGTEVSPNSAMVYLHADETLICIDDVSDEHYNQIAVLDPLHPPKSYEKMRREDEVYRNGAIIEYNAAGIKGRGSCIFIHLNHPDNRPTSGCTAMDREALIELLRWLDPLQHPKILQIPQSECQKYQKEFEGIECPL